MSTDLKLDLYPFATAIIKKLDSEIYPPLFKVTVSGRTLSLNAKVTLKPEGRSEGFQAIDVLGKDGLAIGSIPYEESVEVQQHEGTSGVVVIGRGKRSELPWPKS